MVLRLSQLTPQPVNLHVQSRELHGDNNQADPVKLDINVYGEHSLIHAVAACDYSLTNFMSIIQVIRDESALYGCSKVLVDLTQVSGQVAQMDWFRLARNIVQAWRTIQVAIVYLDAGNAAVFEHIAMTRHARVRVYPLVRPALQWLLPGVSGICLIDQQLCP